MKAVIYPGPGQVGIESRVEQAVRGLCGSRRTAKGLHGKHIPLTGNIVENLVQRMVYAASQAASRPIGNRIRGRGAPPDNARIILAEDVLLACEEVGISPGLRFAPPASFAVDVFSAIAPIIWPTSALNPRKTFERMKRARITRN
jgi:hypothetical protein